VEPDGMISSMSSLTDSERGALAELRRRPGDLLGERLERMVLFGSKAR
jgi:hypothetical protein